MSSQLFFPAGVGKACLCDTSASPTNDTSSRRRASDGPARKSERFSRTATPSDVCPKSTDQNSLMVLLGESKKRPRQDLNRRKTCSFASLTARDFQGSNPFAVSRTRLLATQRAGRSRCEFEKAPEAGFEPEEDVLVRLAHCARLPGFESAVRSFRCSRWRAHGVLAVLFAAEDARGGI